MKKNNGRNKKWPAITEVVRESVKDLYGIVDISETMKNFDRLQYECPKTYTPDRIVRLRKRRLHMSQPVFASVCNIKLPTLQKWERGYSKPTPPVNRLFQLVEKGGLDLIAR